MYIFIYFIILLLHFFLYKNVLTIFFNDSHFIFQSRFITFFNNNNYPRQDRCSLRNLSTINIVLSLLPPFPFSFSFFLLRSSKLTLEHRTTSSTANYFLVIFHRATSTTRATRCLIIAAKMILSMGLPSPPPGPATGQTCDYNANAEYAVPPWNHSIEEGERRRKREGERRERRNRFS